MLWFCCVSTLQQVEIDRGRGAGKEGSKDGGWRKGEHLLVILSKSVPIVGTHSGQSVVQLATVTMHANGPTVQGSSLKEHIPN